MTRKHSLIIGGTKGSGRILAKKFAQEGFNVSVIGRKNGPGQDIDCQGIYHWNADITDSFCFIKVMEKIKEKNGKLNNLVFFQRYRGPDNNWDGEMATSLTATKNIIEHVIDKFEDTEDKSIVIVSSIASVLIAGEQSVSYHVAKAGINQMVRYYAVSLGAKRIRVNSVSPGSILKEEAKEFYLKNNELHELNKRIIPLGRMGSSDDVANVISFLCSPKSAFITGQNIIVDGGLSLVWQESLSRGLKSLDKINITQ